MLDCFQAALAAVDARRCVREQLLLEQLNGVLPGRWHVIAVGKAAGAMALGACDVLGPRLDTGCVVTAPGHVPAELHERSAAVPTGAFMILTGDHPIPGAATMAAGAAIMDYTRALDADAQVLCLVSGGASSLVEYPVPGINLDDLQSVGAWALGSGQPIGVVNSVRRRLSLLKNGGLAHLLGRRRTLALMISDVPGDDPRVIGSGLLHPSPLHEACELPPDILQLLRRADLGRAVPHFNRKAISFRVVASPRIACIAAARKARDGGVTATFGRQLIAGQAATEGARLAHATARLPHGSMRIWSGESTVNLPAAPGRGGRNQHLALHAACVLDVLHSEDTWLLAAGTDGIDGATDDAGALVDARTCERGRDVGGDCRDSLARADSGTFLEAAGDLLHTGATLTNVGDMVLGLRWKERA